MRRSIKNYSFICVENTNNAATEILIQEEAIDGHFVSSEGNFIPTRLSDYYFSKFHGKVPDEWVELFQSSNALGSKAAKIVQYVK